MVAPKSALGESGRSRERGPSPQTAPGALPKPKISIWEQWSVSPRRSRPYENACLSNFQQKTVFLQVGHRRDPGGAEGRSRTMCWAPQRHHRGALGGVIRSMGALFGGSRIAKSSPGLNFEWKTWADFNMFVLHIKRHLEGPERAPRPRSAAQEAPRGASGNCIGSLRAIFESSGPANGHQGARGPEEGAWWKICSQLFCTPLRTVDKNAAARYLRGGARTGPHKNVLSTILHATRDR